MTALSKSKTLFLVLFGFGFVIIIAGSILFPNIKSPAPGFSVPPNWQETQKTLVSGIKIDFKHPPDWSDDIAYCRDGPGESPEEQGCVSGKFLSGDKAQDLAKSITGEKITVGGKKAIRQIKNEETRTYNLLVFDSGKTPLLALVVYFSEDENIETLNQIVSTFQFPKPKEDTLGTVRGEICYPADKLPPGIIRAKDLATGKTFTLDYLGTEDGGETSYLFKLNPATYYLKYFGYGLSGYYTGTKCVERDDIGCSPQYSHKLWDVKVEAGKTIMSVDLCDFYYFFNQIWESEIGF